MSSSALNNLYRKKTLNEVLHAHSDEISDKIAVTVFDAETSTDLSYAEIIRSGLRAAELINKFTKPGDRVLIVMPTSVDFISAFFGCLFSGRIAVPLPVEKPRNGISRSENVISDCSPVLAIFKSAEDLEKMKSGFSKVKSIILDEQIKEIPQVPSDLDYLNISENQIAFIQYTSGSTSAPKGVALTHKNLIANIKMIQQAMKISSEERVVSWLPLHHDMGLIGNLLSFLCCGAFTALYPYQEFARSPMSWLLAMSKYRATLSGAPTFAFELINKKLDLQRLKDVDLKPMRLLYCGSERLVPATISKFYSALAPIGLSTKSFFPCYGMAEASLFVSGRFCEPQILQLPVESGAEYPTCGNLANNLSLSVADEEGQECFPGKVGEIQIKGTSVTNGYWREIKNKVSENGEVKSAESWLKTGDLGALVGNEIIIVGRKKDIIKSNGRTLYPEDIEIQIEQNSPWLSPNSVVIFSEGDDNSRISVVIEVERTKKDIPFAEICGEVNVLVSEFGLQKPNILFLAPLNLPKTTSGKKQRKLTAKLLSENTLKIIWHDQLNLAPNVTSEDSESLSKINLKSLIAYVSKTNFDLAEERRAMPADMLLVVKNAGLLDLLVNKEFGGKGLNSFQFSEIGVTLGQLNLSLAAVLGIHNTLGVLSIQNSKNIELKKTVLREVVQKGSLVSFAISEPAAGSNPHKIEATAKVSGSKIILNGTKVWIGNAQFAEYFVVFANETSADNSSKGISGFLVKSGQPGLQVGEEQLTLGMRSMPQCMLQLTNVEVTEADRLTAPGKGLELAFESMEYARFGLAAVACGVMNHSLALAKEYALSRQIWTGKLSENGHVANIFRDVQLKSQALKKLVEKSAKQIDDSGKLPIHLSFVCKILAGEWAFQATDSCLQICGGRGYTENFGIARFWRDIRLFRIFEGPSEALAYQLGALSCRNLELSADLIKSESARSRLATFISKLSSETNKDTFFVQLGMTIANCVGLSCLDLDIAEPLQNLEIDLLEEKMARSNLMDKYTAPDNRILNVAGEASQTSRPMFEVWNGHATPAQTSPNVTFDIETNRTASKLANSSEQETMQEKPAIERQTLVYRDIQFALEIWLRDLLRVKRIDINASLAEYGVDSLMTYELICFIEESFGVKVQEDFIRAAPSLKNVCDYILQSQQEKLGSIKKSKRSNT